MKRLRKLIYQMQFYMDKKDRVSSYVPMMESMRTAKSWYIRAFEVLDKETRANYMSECIGNFANVRDDLDFIFDENMVHYKKYKREKLSDSKGRKLPSPPLTPEEEKENEEYAVNKKVEIYKVVAQVDTDIRRYYHSMGKGRTIVG